ncbi:MAG: tetratricopeptide repeat protein [Vampirovibrionales bacterium]|nr:tetratricopeptide repeat protein [Vampirovibrionales bacterium]
MSQLNPKMFLPKAVNRIARHPDFTGMMIAGALVFLGAGSLLLQPVFPVQAQLTHVFLDKKPSDTFGGFYFMLGTQMAARGQILAAESLLLKATKLLPDNADAFLNYGVVMEGLDRNEEALSSYQQAARIQERGRDGVNAQTLYTIGLLQDKMGKTEEGIKTLRDAMALEPRNNLIAYDLGVLYSKQEDFNNAAHFSGLSVEGQQDFAEGYNNYGYALAHLGRYKEALDAVNRSLELKPDSAAALDSRGFVYHGMKKYPEALNDYKKALTLDPTIGEIYLHLGETYEQMKDYPNALKAYEQYLQLTPKAANTTEIRSRIAKLKQQDFARKGPVGSPSALNTSSFDLPILNGGDKKMESKPLESLNHLPVQREGGEVYRSF